MRQTSCAVVYIIVVNYKRVFGFIRLRHVSRHFPVLQSGLLHPKFNILVLQHWYWLALIPQPRAFIG